MEFIRLQHRGDKSVSYDFLVVCCVGATDNRGGKCQSESERVSAESTERYGRTAVVHDRVLFSTSVRMKISLYSKAGAVLSGPGGPRPPVRGPAPIV